MSWVSSPRSRSVSLLPATMVKGRLGVLSLAGLLIVKDVSKASSLV